MNEEDGATAERLLASSKKKKEKQHRKQQSKEDTEHEEQNEQEASAEDTTTDESSSGGSGGLEVSSAGKKPASFNAMMKRTPSGKWAPNRRWSASFVDDAAKGTITQHLEAIGKLKELLQDNADYQQLLKGKADEEAMLLRFLRSVNMNVERAHKKLIAHWKWWKETRPDKISQSWLTNSPWFTAGMATFGGSDKQNRPSAIVFPALYNIREKQSPLIMNSTVLWAAESLIKKMPEGVDKFVVILDFSGSSIPKNWDPALLEMLNALEENYPDRLAQLIVVNPSFLFNIAYRAMKHKTSMIPKDMKPKVILLRKAVTERLQQLFDDSQLPVEYGGSLDCLTSQQKQILRERTGGSTLQSSGPIRLVNSGKRRDSYAPSEGDESASESSMVDRKSRVSQMERKYFEKGGADTQIRLSELRNSKSVENMEQLEKTEERKMAKKTRSATLADKRKPKSGKERRSKTGGKGTKKGKLKHTKSEAADVNAWMLRSSLTTSVDSSKLAASPSIIMESRARQKFSWEVSYDELAVGDVLGSGGMGTVYKAMWKGSMVAVKKLKAANDISKEDLRGFLNEIDVMSKLRHPNILLLMGACLDFPNVCIISEYASLGNVHEYLLAYPQTWRRKVQIGVEAARGMNFLHLCNPPCLHLDLKSYNLLVDDFGRVKVCDFGISTLDDLNGSKIAKSTKSNFGTLNWVSPELLDCHPPSTKSDVYAFGMVLYEILCEKVPFQGLSESGVAFAIMEGKRPELPSNTCPKYTALFNDCTKENPAERPDFSEILTRLEEIMNALPVGALSHPLPRPKKKSLNLDEGELDTVTGNEATKGFNDLRKELTAGYAEIAFQGQEGTVTHWDCNAERLFGYTVTEMVDGKQRIAQALIPQRFRERFLEATVGPHAGEYRHKWLTLQAVMKEGKEIMVEMMFTTATTTTTTTVSALVREVNPPPKPINLFEEK